MVAIVRRGLMLVLSSPSGAGKTTITRLVLERDREITMSVSVTTRTPRPGEIDGQDYFFVDQARFEQMSMDDQFLESAAVFGHSYGTPRAAVEHALKSGRDVLFDIDWQGTQQLAHRAPSDVVAVFILPPTHDELERRLTRRAQDTAQVVARRMAQAADEMSHWSEYNYIVVNDDLESSVRAVQSILAAERLRRDRQIGLPDFVARLRVNP